MEKLYALHGKLLSKYVIRKRKEMGKMEKLTYEAPAVDIFMYSTSDVSNLSGPGDLNQGEWDPV